jgi:2-methylcitrate dehydratase PrpD
MPDTIIDTLAEFAANARERDLPGPVLEESKRLLIDALGCAVASVGERGADIGVAFGRVLGGGSEDATILGTPYRTSEVGAGFANAELINALDQDAITPPGHVSPYVVPGALAAAEVNHRSGRELAAAVAVAHEMSYRLGKSIDYLRDLVEGVVTPPKVSGYASTVFGATAAIGVVRHFDRETLANALGIAGSASPTNSHRAWMMHAPATTIKYQLPGALPQTAFMAAGLAELGHRGDRLILDDRDFGWPRFVGTTRWEPAGISVGLGDEWLYLQQMAYKPYPHCRIMHGLFDVQIALLEENDIKVEEITAIRAFGESFVLQPIWLNNEITDVRDAQFSMAHGLAVAAHRVPPGKDWQAPELVFSESVRDLMDKVTYAPHPGYDAAIEANPSARLSRIEIDARGTTFARDSHFPKGVPSPDPESYMTTDELVQKFRHNVDGVVADADAEAAIDALLHLDDVDDVSEIVRRLRARSDEA